MLEILGSHYQTTDKGQHIAPKVDAKIKRLFSQKSSQKNYFCPGVISVIQWTPWLRVDDEVFLVIHKTCIPSDFHFTVITNEIGVMSYSVLM